MDDEKRLNHTWNKLDVVSMAKKVPWLQKYLVPGYYIPMSYAHATVHSMLARWEQAPQGGIQFAAGPQPKQADDSLKTAHILILYIISEQYKHFKLEDCAEFRQRAEADYKEIWERHLLANERCEMQGAGSNLNSEAWESTQWEFSLHERK